MQVRQKHRGAASAIRIAASVQQEDVHATLDRQVGYRAADQPGAPDEKDVHGRLLFSNPVCGRGAVLARGYDQIDARMRQPWDGAGSRGSGVAGKPSRPADMS